MAVSSSGYAREGQANEQLDLLCLGAGHPCLLLSCSEMGVSLDSHLPSPLLFLLVYNIHLFAATAAKSLQSCPTPCDPMDSSPPGSPVPGILQARTLEWVAISFSIV